MEQISPFEGTPPFQWKLGVTIKRKLEVNKLNEILRRHSIVFLVGEAGVGKTTLIREEVLPSLQLNTGYSNHNKYYIHIHAIQSPLLSLSHALANNDMAEASQIYETTRSKAGTVNDVLTLKGYTSENRALLVFDQFEDLYKHSKSKEAQIFLDGIFESYESSVVALIISLRSDSLATIIRNPRIRRYLVDSIVFLDPPAISEYRQAIETLARETGVSFAPGVVDYIIDASKAPGEARPNPLFLQIVLKNLLDGRHSEIIKLEDLAKTHSVDFDRLLTNYVLDFFHQLDSKEILRLRYIIPLLVTSSGLRNIVPINNFDALDSRIINLLADRHLVICSVRNGKRFVELPHDRMAAKMSHIINEVCSAEQRQTISLSALLGTFGYSKLQKKLEKRISEINQLKETSYKLTGEQSMLEENIDKIKDRVKALEAEVESNKPKVFISYAREDEQVVYKLYQKLKDEGTQPWFDKEDLKTGVEWDLEIRKALQKSDFIVICISSRTAVKRGYIQRELKQALDCYEEIPPGVAFLMPVRLEKCDIPDCLNKYQYTDLFKNDGFDRLVESIVSHWAKRENR